MKKNKITLFLHYAALIINYLLMILIVGFVIFVVLAGFLLLFEDAPDYKFARFIIIMDHTVSSYRLLPVVMRGTNIYRYMVVFAGLSLAILLNIAGNKLRNGINELRTILQSDKLRKPEVKPGVKKSKHASKSKLHKLIKAHSNIEQQLEKMNMKLTFLSIDVFDPDAMKIFEDPSMVECDFMEYRRYVEKKLSDTNCIKFAWTSDGILSCFIEFKPAFKTAREIITGLEKFNTKVKSIKSDFAVRCGINSGDVYFDDTLPLEDISDKAIDIAVHVQKQAEPNTLYATKQAIEPLKLLESFQPLYDKIDDCPVYVWGNKIEVEPPE